MSQVSQFCIQQRSALQNKNTLTPMTTQSKYQNGTNRTIQMSKSNYRCNQCSQYLGQITQAKKHQIKLQYEVQLLKQQIQRLKRQNNHLISVQYQKNCVNVTKYNPIMYYKQDLESQLYQSKYLLQLMLLSDHSKQNLSTFTNKPSIKMESQKQKQVMQKIMKPYDLKKKCEQLLLQNVRLNERNMIKDKIIQQRSLFPLYHYDQRILTLRKNVQFWYRRSQQQSLKLKQMLDEMKKLHKQVKRQAKLMIEQEKVHWEKEIHFLKGKIMASCYNELNLPQNRTSQNFNILIQNDKTVICQQIKKKKQEKKLKTSVCLNKSTNQSKILCKDCMNTTINKNQITNSQRTKNLSKILTKQQQKYDSAKISNKSMKAGYKMKNQVRNKEKHRKNDQNEENTSMISKNFAKIQIKLNDKEKQINKINRSKQKVNQKSVNKKISKRNQQSSNQHIACQRCANKLI